MNTNDESWKDISGFEGLYQVSDKGRVKSLNYNHTAKEGLLRPGLIGSGYYAVVLSNNGARRTIRVHRLVANAFLPNPNYLPQINHKDENPLNNEASNLEWCDQLYNNNYGSHNLKVSKGELNHPKKSKKVGQFTKDGSFIATYPSLMEASRKTGIRVGQISNCCHNRYGCKTAGGYKWDFILGQPNENTLPTLF